jgi:hypothetical protein
MCGFLSGTIQQQSCTRNNFWEMCQELWGPNRANMFLLSQWPHYHHRPGSYLILALPAPSLQRIRTAFLLGPLAPLIHHRGYVCKTRPQNALSIFNWAWAKTWPLSTHCSITILCGCMSVCQEPVNVLGTLPFTSSYPFLYTKTPCLPWGPFTGAAEICPGDCGINFAQLLESYPLQWWKAMRRDKVPLQKYKL